LLQNGRETVLKVSVFGDSEIDLESEVKSSDLAFQGEIGELIEKWLDVNTVNGQYSTSTLTDRYAFFEQVRIPMFNKDGLSIDSRRFFRGILETLQKTDKNVSAKLITRGLGEARIILGSK
jgi:hypothetical protein